MNERIKELLKQSCGFEYDEDGNELTPILVGKDLAKFAELIVGECINWIDGSPTTEEGSLILSKHFIIANLKHHFGVEE